MYIFGGKRHKQYLNDFFTYDVETQLIKVLMTDITIKGGPHTGYTQRATIDCDGQEIFVLTVSTFIFT